MHFEKRFKNPDQTYRPKMRWWLPGAFMEKDEIKREIISLVEAGYGGAEVLYFMPIPSADIAPEQYGDYYFGSEKWNDCMRAALETAIEYNFKLDFTVGPLWPIATPALMDKDDERAAHGLHVGCLDFTRLFQGKLLIPDTIDRERKRKLVAVSVAKKSLDKQLGLVATYQLDSIQVLPFSEEDETVEWTALDDDEWTLFAFWAQTSAQLNDAAQAPVIDHLSEEATKAVIDYWENSLLSDPYIRELYEKNGGDLFCDSLEVNATMLGGMYDAEPAPVILWTPDLLIEFKKRRGYDLAPYLPALFIRGLFQTTDNRNLDRFSEYEFEQPLINRSIRHDYYETLTDLINEKHISVLQSWAHSHNMKLRYQTYGLPTDMTSSLMSVDVPEAESLGFKDNTESVRLLSGAVHMGRKPIYSYELGAVQGKAYEQQWTGADGLLWKMHQALAGGVNQVVLHGMSYNSSSVTGPVEPIFNWPGLSLMGTAYSNEWGNRQPIFEHSRMMTDYISRLQFILRQGRPRVDLAIYRHEYDGVNYSMEVECSSLQQAGYTYDYISPVLLQLDNATVEIVDGEPVLDSKGAAYKALVVSQLMNRETKQLEGPKVNVEVMKKFIHLASEGLPIIWVGDQMLQPISYEDANHFETINSLYKELTSFSNVFVINKAELGELTISKGFDTIKNNQVASVRRQTDSTDLYFLYNQSTDEKFAGTITVKGKGQPYLLDLWSGDITALQNNSLASTGFTFNLEMEPGETKLIALGKLKETRKEADYRETTEMFLNKWHLAINSWEAGETPTSTVINKYECQLDDLIPWKEINGLEKVAGIGLYETRVLIPHNVSRAILDIGCASDTAKVIVNGEHLQLNQVSWKVDIAPYLFKGENIIQVEVATTLHNALSLYDHSKVPVNYGMMGPVKLKLTNSE
ncbi:glycosyl hydrolase [Paenibacillus gallinarum]|uniref:Alpha-L-rhamnosidase-like protein n=1 Tax=Paenibacillus gallinarum TaxID=2762232 RepID=A0ABR8T619_9BACL|nr:glycosyl hydrolase [Paenibacillus gallinarum]MBD7971212.1 hypothetical protein [Paenibacillus gallinarum]